MTEKISFHEYDSTNSEKLQHNKSQKPLSITFVRLCFCLGIITSTLFLKTINQESFKNLSCWYRNNILYECSSANEFYQKTKNFILNPSKTVENIKTILNSFKL